MSTFMQHAADRVPDEVSAKLKMTITEAAAFSKLPLSLRAKICAAVGLPLPQDRRGKHWAERRGARRCEVREPGRRPLMMSVEEAAAFVGVAPEFLRAGLARSRRAPREFAEGDVIVVEVAPLDPKPEAGGRGAASKAPRRRG